MWEYVANLVYGLVLRRVRLGWMTVLAVAAGALTVMLSMNIDIFGVLEARSYAAYTVVGGWSLTPDQLLVGVSRLSYPFIMGLLISRVDWMKIDIRRHGFIWCSLLLAAALVIPRVGGTNPENFWMNGLYESAIILLLFPAIIMMGRGSTVAGERYEGLCKLLGDISYPLYVTHYPLIYMQMSWAATHPDAPTSTHIFMACCFFVLATGLAYASMKLYDEPVRKWLAAKFLRK